MTPPDDSNSSEPPYLLDSGNKSSPSASGTAEPQQDVAAARPDTHLVWGKRQQEGSEPTTKATSKVLPSASQAASRLDSDRPDVHPGSYPMNRLTRQSIVNAAKAQGDLPPRPPAPVPRQRESPLRKASRLDEATAQHYTPPPAPGSFRKPDRIRKPTPSSSDPCWRPGPLARAHNPPGTRRRPAAPSSTKPGHAPPQATTSRCAALLHASTTAGIRRPAPARARHAALSRPTTLYRLFNDRHSRSSLRTPSHPDYPHHSVECPFPTPSPTPQGAGGSSASQQVSCVQPLRGSFLCMPHHQLGCPTTCTDTGDDKSSEEMDSDEQLRDGFR